MADTNLLQVALNHTDTTVIICSPLRNGEDEITDFRVQSANAGFEAITGHAVSESTDVTVRDILQTRMSPSVWTQAIGVVETGLPTTIDSQFITSSGEPLWFSIAMRPHENGISLFLYNITDYKQTEQELRKTIDELQRSNKNLEQFAYVASHDLQEPLRKLAGFGEILQHQYEHALGEQGISLVQRMQSATQRMQVLIRDLLSFSRVTSTREPFSRINLQTVVDDVLNDLEPIIREKKAVLDITSLPYLEGDAGQLGQLFQNLLSNALKFTQPGEIPLIRIDCEVMAGSAIQPLSGTTVITTDLSRSFFAITVSDNGVGFDEKYLDRIFTIFQRLYNRNAYPGTGIGLAVVQKVVENHKGYLNARSQPGQGADFTVYLPDEPAQIGVIRGL